MDANNFVAPDGAGSFVVTVGGQSLGSFNDQHTAENIFNAASGIGPGGESVQAPATSVDPALLQQNAQQQASMSWANLLGFTTNGMPPPNTPTMGLEGLFGAQGMPTPGENTLPAQEQVGLVNTPGGGQTPTVGAASDAARIAEAFGQGAPTGTVSTPNAFLQAFAGKPTLGNQENFAQQFGSLGSFGTPNGATPYTLDMQKFLAGLIESAKGGFADPFTNLAKNQTLGSGFLGNILRNYIGQATGTPASQLAQGTNLTNVQLAGDLANNAVGGSMSPATNSYLSRLFGAGAPGGGQPTGGGGGGQPASGPGHTIVMNNPILGANPGWMTSLQDYNQLSPTAQQAYGDLQQFGPNGQTGSDFQQQLKAGGPQFARAGTGAAYGSVSGF